MKSIVILLMMSMLFVSCGKKTKNAEGEGMAVAMSYMDSKQYEKAIVELEQLSVKHPDNREIRVRLAHAYAGAGSFETIRFAEIVKELEKTKLKGDVKEILVKARKALDFIPTLSKHQRGRLSKAINLYNELGLDPYSTSRENNFKWGVLHVYRLLVTVKDMVVYTEEIVEDHERFSDKEVQKFFMDKGDLLAQDTYQSYLMFKHSFKKLEKIANKVEALIAKTINNKDFKIKIKGKARNYKQFAKNIIDENSKVISEAISKIADKIALSDFNGSIKKIFLGFKENKEDVDKRLKKIEILVRLFLDNVILKHPQKNEELKGIFTPELQEKAELALIQSKEERNLDPLKQFLQDQNSNMKIISDAWEILMAEYQQSEIELIIEPEVDVLLSYINKEEVEILKEKAKEVQELAEQELKDSADKIEENNRNASQELKDMIEEDAKDINDDIGTEVDEVKDAFEEDDPELEEKGEKIIDEVREYVES